jgi:serine/threonine protein kinase
VSPRFDVPVDRFHVRLGDYEKIKKIGGGAFGGVYSARQKATGVIVAVKELTPDTSDTGQRESYRREVLMLGTLKHPAILTLHGCTPFDHPSGPAILTPLLKASVAAHVSAERRGESPACWTPTQKHVVLLGIASGMAFMHGHRCIHRDLKPANVLLDDQCEPRICDFGLSKFVQRGATLSQSTRGGTPQFMAPAVYLDDRYDFKVDVYAFAVLMFVVLTGLEPFSDCRNQMVLARRVMNGDRPTIPGSLGAGYAQLIQECWDTSPEKRPGFEEIVFRLGKEECMEGLDLEAVKKYQARVCPPKLVPLTTAALARKV